MGNNAGARGLSALCTYYAVRRGDESVGIYLRWEEVEKNVRGQAGLLMMTFESWDDANEWMRTPLAGLSTRRRKRKRTSSTSRTSPHRARSSRFNPEFSDDEESANASSTSEGAALPTSSVRDQDVSSQPCPISLDGAPSSSTPTPPASADSLLPVSLSEEERLSPEQQAVFDRVKAGHNLFFTGAAGTGKSYLLRKIVEWARETRKGHQVAVTASTGMAAINIGGGTIYKWAGIGFGKEEPEVLFEIITNASYGKNTRTGQKFMHRDSPLMHWKNCKILILDEVSMVDGRLIDKLDWLGRHIRNVDKPWGGIQVIFCGDFFQLPPVGDHEDDTPIPSTMAFESVSWPKTVGKPIALKKVFRQDDPEFVDMLNALRIGQLSAHHIRRFQELDRAIVCPEGIEPIQLFPVKDRVNGANNKRLADLPGRVMRFRSIDRPGYTKHGEEYPLKTVRNALWKMVALENLELKEGAQVMLIKNLVDGQLVNGSMGRVVGFKPARKALQEHIAFGLPQCLNEWPKEGRKTSIEDPPDWLLEKDDCWPVVEFTKSRRRILCVRMNFETVDASGRTVASRAQVPLIPAWAMSVHKSQGMTIDYLKVDLARSFENGQVYVALSRASSREGLQVCNFDPMKVKTHPRVIEWMKTAMDDGEDREQ